MAKSPEEYAHLEWLGYVQPVGLVVSIPAMLEAQCYVNKNIMGDHAQFLSCLSRNESDEIIPEIRDLRELTQKVLGWEEEDLKEVPPHAALTGEMAALEVVLPQYHETLRPTHAVPVFRPKEDENPWMLLIQELPTGTKLDEAGEPDSSRHWNAAPQAKFERLLRETQVPIGLLSNGQQLRLVYSPRGESSGHATFNVDEMIQVAGRPMFAALQMLLCNDRMFSLGENQRLPAILKSSRKYQNAVSTALAEQVLAALYELMRGFQAANDVRQGELLKDVLANNPNPVYAGLLRVLMRLVFLMYAEDRDLLSSDPIYSNYYSVTGLFNRLREDAGRYPDTMTQRFGAWSQLITLFRLIYEGGQHGEFKIPGRKGYLFDPDRYPFLEGRQLVSEADVEESPIPRISDHVVFTVLQNLLILNGERLSYRTLDVEQIGSVYETVMGFNLEVATGKSIAIKPAKSHGAPATINLEALLETPGKDRAKWLKEHADQKLGAGDAKLFKAAESIDDLLTALDRKIAKKVTPRVVPSGAIVLQPSDERRRSGSHYTPRSLTEPTVQTTLEPILKQLCDPDSPLQEVYTPSKEDKKRYTKGELAARVALSEKAIESARQAHEVGTPHPLQILDLKICDPAMGSGAFLVETCRQLAEELINAWYAHDAVPANIPPDEDEVLYARRLIAQRCLYGVDKNDMAVDLAKLSLWLVTLAKDHAFTFLDHSLRHGDSLVGLTRRQIIGFHWEPKKQKQFGEALIQRRLDRATEARAKILNAREDVSYRDQEQRLGVANEALNVVRLTGDACVSTFFAGSKKKQREELCEQLLPSIAEHYQNLKNEKLDQELLDRIEAAATSLKTGEHPISPFHWEIEFPEVFARANSGFDAFVGNPPFLGGWSISGSLGKGFLDFINEVFPETGGQADLVAYFFRNAYRLLRYGGTLGLIATNTISQGDTRSSGLGWICENDGTLYCVHRRRRWPGEAAVIVSVVHLSKGLAWKSVTLDSKRLAKLTSYFFHRGGNGAPQSLSANKGRSFKGTMVYGMGFTFDDADSKGVATPIAEMNRLIDEDSRNAERTFPYIGGEELNSHPHQLPDRFVINFGDMSLEKASAWPKLLQIVEEKVKPERMKQKREVRKRYWWRFGETTPALFKAIAGLERVIALSSVGQRLAFSFLPNEMVYSHSLIVFAIDDDETFGVLQCRVHEVWARFFSSSMKDDLRYTPPDCFEAFPFPIHSKQVSQTSLQYIDGRQTLMASNEEGLTKTYNRFHDPHEHSEAILELRRLHGLMDVSVLRAYGWDDLADQAAQPDFCQFLLDYEEEENDDPNAKKSKKKKPWRLRWPDEFRDEVLARLLELNEQRHQEEVLTGKTVQGKQTKKPTKAKSKSLKKLPNSNQREMF
ncbi:MAG: SAM-dependent methyltransferase [Blastopirellula sp.]|nr:MAG: SAM-dependent methyltransferase [Blastopirellula sp.]